jgi:hypothetical protein
MKNITWLNILLGVWLLVAPFALSKLATIGAWTANDIVVGILLMSTSWTIVATARPAAGAAWFEVACGIWLVFAPFVLKYSSGPMKLRNDVISGIVAIVVAVIALASIRRTHIAA